MFHNVTRYSSLFQFLGLGNLLFFSFANSTVAAPIPTKDSENPFPRRLFAIGISDYLYANPLRHGSAIAEDEKSRRDFFSDISLLANSWRIPREQQYFLTDGPVADRKIDDRHPPIKKVIEGSILRFLDSCRAQDRVVLIFSGHAVEKDGEAYLVPLDGELDDLASLISIKDFYASLQKCPAQEKLVIVDVCRFDSGRGFERRAFGKMTLALEKALHACPEGTTVWTSCSAGQYSLEFEYWQASVPDIHRMEFFGSVFLGLFRAAEIKRGLLSRPGGKVYRPNEPIELDLLVEYVQKMTAAVAKDLEGAEQTPKFTSRPTKKAVTYNPIEAPARKIDLPEIVGIAKKDEVTAIANELRLTAIWTLTEGKPTNHDMTNYPFLEANLKSYYADGPSLGEIQQMPEKFVKQFPVRVAVVEAFSVLKRNPIDEPVTRLRAPLSAVMKKRLGDVYQRITAAQLADLDKQIEGLKIVAKRLATEKSKRWLAHFDYVRAQLLLRVAFLSEYNLALAQAKQDKLPIVDGKVHSGWALWRIDKMASPKETTALVDEAQDIMRRIAKEHPNTPWAVLAKRQRETNLGLQWRPTFEPD